jgi:hypothetical protein
VFSITFHCRYPAAPPLAVHVWTLVAGDHDVVAYRHDDHVRVEASFWCRGREATAKVSVFLHQRPLALVGNPINKPLTLLFQTLLFVQGIQSSLLDAFVRPRRE